MIEFLVAILSGAKYLQDISLVAHPLDKDVAVTQAWGQKRWADVNALVEVLEQVSHHFCKANWRSCVPKVAGWNKTAI